MNDSDANAVEGAVAEVGVETLTIPEIKEEPYNPAMDPKYRFDLTVWLDGKTPEEHFAEAEQFIKDFPKYKGKLSEPEMAKEALISFLAANKSFIRCYYYCVINFFANMKDDEAKKLNAKCSGLYSQFAAATAFIDPEILSLDKELIKTYRSSKWFDGAETFFDNIVRYKAHTRSAEVEETLAAFFVPQNLAEDKMDKILSDNIAWKTIKLSDGTEFLCNVENYAGEGRAKKDPADRKLIYDTFFGTLEEHSAHIIDVLEITKNMQHVVAVQKNFESSYEQMMFSYRVGKDFFPTLKARVKSMLPVFHRFLKIKKAMLGVEKLNYYDLFAPDEISEKPVGMEIEPAKDLIRRTMAFMPKEYCNKIEKMLDPDNHYIDVYPRPGKRGGAFCSTPYMGPARFLLNHTTDSIYPVSTFIHEMGHAIQGEMSYENNPFVGWNFPGLVMEIPSMFPELVFADKLIKDNPNPRQKLNMLYDMVDGIRTGVFRQMAFAELEEYMFELAKENKPFILEELRAKYLEIIKEYYGANEGIIDIPDLAGLEFLYVGHFAMNWYLPKYIFSGLSGWLMYAAIQEGKVSLDDFVQMHKMGSRVPEPFLFTKMFGLDMASEETYSGFAKQYSGYLDIMETSIADITAQK